MQFTRFAVCFIIQRLTARRPGQLQIGAHDPIFRLGRGRSGGGVRDRDGSSEIVEGPHGQGTFGAFLGSHLIEGALTLRFLTPSCHLFFSAALFLFRGQA